MGKNTGTELEDRVFEIVKGLVQSNQFMISNPYVKVHKKKAYYSKDRGADITFDVTVEKYLDDPYKDDNLYPSIIVVIECKDYSGSIPVNDVEEFHAKLQQVGADNTKGIMITREATYQKGAINFAASQHIALARILPDNQVSYVLYNMTGFTQFDLTAPNLKPQNIVRALTKTDYTSTDGESFYSSPSALSLESLIESLLD